MDVVEEHKQEQLIERKEVETTPFQVISIKDKKQHFGVLGEYRITEVYEKASQVEEELKKITWERIIQVMMIINEKLNPKTT